MFTCREFLGWLSEYLDETAAAEIRAQVEAHLTSCPNCFVIFDTTKKTLQVYKGMEPQAIPPNVHNRLMDAIQKRVAKA